MPQYAFFIVPLLMSGNKSHTFHTLSFEHSQAAFIKMVSGHSSQPLLKKKPIHPFRPLSWLRGLSDVPAYYYYHNPINKKKNLEFNN